MESVCATFMPQFVLNLCFLLLSEHAGEQGVPALPWFGFARFAHVGTVLWCHGLCRKHENPCEYCGHGLMDRYLCLSSLFTGPQIQQNIPYEKIISELIRFLDLYWKMLEFLGVFKWYCEIEHAYIVYKQTTYNKTFIIRPQVGLKKVGLNINMKYREN